MRDDPAGQRHRMSVQDWLQHRALGLTLAPEPIGRWAQAVDLYYRRSVGRQATIITFAAFFLTFPLLIAFLLIVEKLCAALPKFELQLARMLEVPPGVDVGETITSAFTSSMNAFVGFVGVVGLVLAAASTASNLRVGINTIFGRVSPRASMVKAPALDFGAGITLATVLLASWLFALGSLTRRGLAGEVVGQQLPGPAVLMTKLAFLLLAIGFLYLAFLWTLRRVEGPSRSSKRIGSLMAALLVVASNYAFLYFLMSTLLDPAGGGGFAVAIVLLFWTSGIFRALLMCFCWVAAESAVVAASGGGSESASLETDQAPASARHPSTPA